MVVTPAEARQGSRPHHSVIVGLGPQSDAAISSIPPAIMITCSNSRHREPGFGVDGSLAINRSYGPGALIGLPATLTKRTYSMTATVGQNAELGFWPSGALQLLLRHRPELCQQLLAVLGERISETSKWRRPC